VVQQHRQAFLFNKIREANSFVELRGHGMPNGMRHKFECEVPPLVFLFPNKKKPNIMLFFKTWITVDCQILNEKKELKTLLFFVNSALGVFRKISKKITFSHFLMMFSGLKSKNFAFWSRTPGGKTT
jgi:hypothetical protein